MPFKSRYDNLEIPECNILTYLFSGQPGNKPLWINAADPSRSLSAAQMLLWIKRFAVGLDNLGIDKGRAVMVFTPNHLYVPMAFLSAAGSGRIFTGANPAYTIEEVTYQMKLIEAAVVLIHPSLLETGLAAVRKAGIPQSRVFQFSDEEREPYQGIKDWRTFVASEAEAEKWKWDSLEGQASKNTVMAINFSSGTTGLPKGVCITHYNLVANVMQVIFNKCYGTQWSLDNPPPERWLAFLPLYHAYSQLFTINIACKLQIPVYVMQTFVYEEFLKCIEKYKISAIQAAPPIIAMIGKRPETKKYDISSLKHIKSAAAPLKYELQNDVSRRFNVVIAQGWGMTETTCSAIMIPGMINDETGSIGWILPNTEAMLVDDEGKEVSLGETGEVWLRGPQMLKEYWKNPEATKNTKTEDGWLKTGDIGKCEDGKWWIVDRKKEMIKVNGLQVAPAELEAVLLDHADVVDAAVVGIELHGEEWPRAYVVLQDPGKKRDSNMEKDIQKHVENKVAKHKRISGGVKFVEEVPRLLSGKIRRKILRSWAAEDAKQMEGKVKARL